MPRLPQLTARELVRFLKSLSIAAANFTNRFNEALGTELELTAPPGAPRT